MSTSEDLDRLNRVGASLRDRLASLQSNKLRLEQDLHRLKSCLVDVEVLCQLAAVAESERSVPEVPDPLISYTYEGEGVSRLRLLEDRLRKLYADSTQTVSVVLRLPEECSPKGEWIINIGQRVQGAHHWYYNPASTDFPVQLGAWGAGQSTKPFPEAFLRKATRTWVRITTTYDAASKTFKVYLEDQLHDTVKDVTIRFFDIEILIGETAIPEDNSFTGSIKSVEIWNCVLTADLVSQL